ncbi:MAG: efflux RND transporter periplasmic adaptor subunit, partial [Bacteroidia bacterium]|nr:efflux RND transporter periplasmic adaptor subunit [Bacteroidia bacterium]
VAANYIVAKSTILNSKLYSSGQIGAINQIEIIAEIQGKITAINFKEGESVKKGEVLIKINDADIQAQLAKNKVQVKLANEKLSRLKKLLEVKGVSQEEYDIQENEVNLLNADQLYLLAQLAKTSIIAPFDGVVGLKNISVGSFVNSNTVIASLVQLQPVYIEFSLPERYSQEIEKNFTINFSYENNTNTKEYKAVIYAIEPVVDKLTKTIKIRAMYNGSEKMYPGSFVKVFVELNQNNGSILIPTQSIIPVLKGQKVIICKNGLAEERRVVTGIRTDDKIQILEGLNDGDTILTTALLSAKSGTKLNLIHSKN